MNGARWSVSLKTWHLPDTKEYWELFNISVLDNRETNPNIISKIDQFVHWLWSKRYSESTLKTYCQAIRVFLNFFDKKPVNEIDNSDIIKFNNEYILEKKLSSSYQNQMVNAVKLFFRIVENRKLVIEQIHRPKKPKTLPNVLSKAEVKAILEAHTNSKHRTMLSLIYACGLRRSELLNLKPIDIDSGRGILQIKQPKVKKTAFPQFLQKS